MNVNECLLSINGKSASLVRLRSSYTRLAGSKFGTDQGEREIFYHEYKPRCSKSVFQADYGPSVDQRKSTNSSRLFFFPALEGLHGTGVQFGLVKGIVSSLFWVSDHEARTLPV